MQLSVFNALGPISIHTPPTVALTEFFQADTELIRRNQSTTSQILTIRQILGVRAKNLEAIILFVDFSKAFESIHRGKIEQIQLAYAPPTQETVAAIMMLYKNTKVKVSSPDGDTDYLDIVAGVLQGDTLAHISRQGA